jgi:hypothetical protein
MKMLFYKIFVWINLKQTRYWLKVTHKNATPEQLAHRLVEMLRDGWTGEYGDLSKLSADKRSSIQSSVCLAVSIAFPEWNSPEMRIQVHAWMFGGNN